MTKRPRTREQRMALFFYLLEKRKSFSSFRKATQYMIDLMNCIEEKFHADSSLRMEAAAISEYALYCSDGSIRSYEHKKHVIFITSKGAIQVYERIDKLPIYSYCEHKPFFIKKDREGNTVFKPVPLLV